MRILVMCILPFFFFFSDAKSLNAQPESGSALIIIDVQKAFSAPDGFSPVCREQADNMLPVINKLVETFAAQKMEIIYILQDYVRDTELDSRLKIVGDIKFTKKQPSSFSNRKFEEYLQSKDIKHLYIVGLAAEYCVSATISDALAKGYLVTVFRDAIAAKYCTLLKDEMSSYVNKGAKILLSEEL